MVLQSYRTLGSIERIARRVASRFLGAGKAPKKPQGDEVPVNPKDEKLLDKLWDELNLKNPTKKKADEEGEGKSKNKGSVFSSEAFQEFWGEKYEDGKKRVQNKNPKTKDRYPEVAASTALKSDGAFRKKVLEEFKKWKGEGEEAPPSSLFPRDRYEKARFNAVNKSAVAVLKKFNLAYEDVCDLTGLAALGADGEIHFEGIGSGKMEVSYKSKDVEITRTIDFETKTIRNEELRILTKKPGLGTKVFASQVDAARRSGFKHLECDAKYEPPEWSGGVVWPKFGYEADLGRLDWDDETYDAAIEIIERHGLNGGWVSNLMRIPEGREFWSKNCPEWVHGMKFDLSPTSMSSKVFGAYAAAKGLMH